MSLLRTPALLLALLLAPVAARAQAPAPAELPRCADQGVTRMAVMVTQGDSPESLRAMLQGSGVLRPETELEFFYPNQMPPLANPREFRPVLQAHANKLVRERWKIDGTARTLVLLDEEGAVRQVLSRTDNRMLDRRLEALWKRARFEPIAYGGCRVPVLMQLPMSFETDTGGIRINSRIPI